MTQSGGAPAGPLAGITVVDLTRVLAGPYCTMILADLGARVIKVEAPDRGDDARHFGPFVGGRSAYFESLNHGKESITLDLKAPDDRGIFNRLLARADVLVENFRAGTMERLGYGWEELHRHFPRLIYAATSGFGHTGPYAKRPAYDLVVQGMGGIMSLTGSPGGPPTRVGTSVGDITAGLFTAIGVNAALLHRQKTDQGMKVDVSMLDAQVAILENAIVRYCATGKVPKPLGSRHPSIAPFDAYATRDGHIVIAAGNDSLFERLCRAIGRADLASNPLFVNNGVRAQHVTALKDELEATLAARDTAAWLDVLESAGVPCGPINTVDRVMRDEQVLARNMVVTLGDGGHGVGNGPLKVAGNPIKLSAFADPTARRPAPELDADRETLLHELATDG
ncbi:MAG: CoA transferase [Inquilinus sp.]|nr:CoA transferase [Inquilinus sp.]